ncbi:hypothetical protein LZ554_007893 [Drepanopeziza brunnea f. sp. 'monogermtubi']|nr:hypothetical protein LZ554_007893 [Drepanopeziza brunnea f. sp. 'monogermtubi']
MADDPEALAAKVAHLQTMVNRAKNREIPEADPSYAYQQSHPYPSRGSRGGSGRSRGTYRGRGGGRSTVYRNNSLVLNGAATPQATTNENTPPATTEAKKEWTTKPTRQSLQLIKGDVFEKVHAQSREQSRKQKLKVKEQREQARIEKELQILDSRSIMIQDIRFQVMSRGKKLYRLPGGDIKKATPKLAVVAGVKFLRSKNGHLYRDSSLRLFRIDKKKAIAKPCRQFSITGSCSKGPDCPFIHDPSKVAVCHTMPACMHFVRGNCNKANCRYSHVRVSPTALVCKSFGNYGYCEKGLSCNERHVNECPAFSNTGTCPVTGCQRPHRHKASNMRANNARAEESCQADEDHISSDEDADSDVDSDEVEEFFGDEDGVVDQDIPNQQDYVTIRT